MSGHANRDFEGSSLQALRSLAGSTPGSAVQRRIVEGALARRERRGLPWKPIVGALSLAGAAAAVALVVDVGSLAPARTATDGGLASLPTPAAGETVATGRYAVGPHRIEVDPGGQLRFEGVDPAAASFRLEAGIATFEVEKLAPGGSFRVHTPQALVEVVGTRFEVGVEGDCTSVDVSEGRVRVTGPAGRAELPAGESGRYCAAVAGLESLVREAVILVSQGRDLDRAAELLERYRADAKDTALEEEALFYLTLAKARLGEQEEARELARTFQSRFADSPRAARLQEWMKRAVP